MIIILALPLFSPFFIIPKITANGADFASSDPTKWQIGTCKAVDTTDESGVGAVYRDILAVYYYEATYDLYFRVDFLNLSSGYASYLDLYIFMDFELGGNTQLPDNIYPGGQVNGYEWELCVAIYDSTSGKLYYNKDNYLTSGFQWKFHNFQGMLACNVSKSTADDYGYSSGETVYIRVATTQDWVSGLKDIYPNDNNLGDGYWDGTPASSAGSTITTKVAFVHHGNQHTNPFVGGVIDDGAGHGFVRTLQSHEYYQLPVNLHISGTLMAALAWGIPSFLNRVKNDVSSGLVEIVGSVYGQHIMPYLDEALNIWALNEHRKMCQFFFGASPNVSWVPERVWKSFIDNDFTASGFKAVILDGKWHYEDWKPGGSPGYHYTYGVSTSVTLYAFFLDERWYGEYLPQINVDLGYKRHWAGINLAGDEKQICVLGDDWEKTAGVAGWPNVNPERYDSLIRWLAGAKPWIQLVKFSDYLDWYSQPTSGISFDITNQAPNWGTWPDGNYDSWYIDFKNWYPYGCTKTAETHWKDVLSELGYQSSFNTSTPAGRLRDLAMLILAANLYETGWHEWDGLDWVLAGWGKEMWSHLRYAMMPTKAADWVENLPSTPKAYWDDVDDDGYDELVMCNAKLFMVFERIGGRIVFIATSDGYVELGNFMVQYRGTEGDYNDDDHVGSLTDKWYTYNDHDYSHDTYTIVNETTSSYAQIKLTSPDTYIEKRVKLENGSHGFRATYNLEYASTLYVRLGSLCPGVKNLLYYGPSALDQIGGSGQGYLGWRNVNTNTTAVGAWQYPNAQYSWQWTLTVAEMFEIKSGSGKTNFQFDMVFGPLNLGEDQGITELSLITPYLVHLDVNSTFSVGTRLVVIFYNTIGEHQANKTVWTGVTPNYVILSRDIFHPLGMPIENATLALTDDQGNILQTVASLLIPRYAEFSLVDAYTVHLELDYNFLEGSNLTVIFYSYFSVYRANTTVWNGSTPARVQLSINITHPLGRKVENATLVLTYKNGTIIRTVTSFLAPLWAEFSLVTLYVVHLEVNGTLLEGSRLLLVLYSYSGGLEMSITVWTGATPANITLSENYTFRPLPVENATLVVTDDLGNVLKTVKSLFVRKSDLMGRLAVLDYLWTVPGANRTAIMREYVAIDGQWPYAPS